MPRNSQIDSLDYSCLESRELLAIDFGVFNHTLTILQTAEDIPAFGSVLLKDEGSRISLTFSDVQNINSNNLPGMIHFDAIPDTLYIEKEAFTRNEIKNVLINLSEGTLFNATFNENVDLTDLSGSFSFFTRGSLVQSGPLNSNRLVLSASEITLDHPDNQLGEVSVVSSALIQPSHVTLTNSTALTLGDISATSALTVKSGALSLQGILSVPGTIDLQTNSSINQAENSTLFAGQVLVSAAGDAYLIDETNRIDRLAGNVGGDLFLGFSQDLHLDRGDFKNFVGLLVHGEAWVNGTANFSQGADTPIIVVGSATFNLGHGSLLLAGADSDSDGLNDNNLFELNIQNARNVHYEDFNNLNLGVIEVENQGWFRSGSSAAGRMTLTKGVRVHELLMQSSSGIQQVSGNIQTDHALIGGNAVNANYGNIGLLGSNAIAQLSLQSSKGTVAIRTINQTTLSGGVFTFDGQSESFQGVLANSSFALEADAIEDNASASLLVGTSLDLRANRQIVLGNDSSNTLVVHGNSTVKGSSIDLGSMGVAQMPVLNLNATENVVAKLFSDASLVGNNQAQIFDLQTNGNLSSISGSSVQAALPSRFSAVGDIHLARTSDSSISMGDVSFFSEGHIRIGGFDNATIGRINFQSTGDTLIHVVGYLNLYQENWATNLDLFSTLVIRDAASATLTVSENSRFSGLVGVSLADTSTNLYHLCGISEFKVGSYALVHEPGNVMVHEYHVLDNAFADINIDSTDC